MTIATFVKSWRRLVAKCLLILTIGLGCLLIADTQPALAKFDNDSFDGNIFVLYAGNGSLVPPKVTLAQSLKREQPTLLVFYTDDSRDCKQYATVVSRLQAYYGRAADLIPISVDAIPPKSTYTADEPGYYYSGFVPQVVLFDQSGKIVLNEKGQVPFERVDDAFRKVFNLLPRSESVELKQRAINEFNTELVK
ncbi:MAG TPA: hypothetical protein DDW76_24440 [Cyanobacteria bacterium UBA11369]|nr:hypothetical protein [Cyanobacteria bacterium UBA11371]HBE32373.1 hypothetical protein [Cyanobacteria bacterium UBA11368]HBE51836.1 hypothetical protein [Cyanobacteria bacterium UBA11369]